MGYIKKLKNNELVGGTDKHTIYPVTSTKAVFEEVTEGDKSSFKSQETINGEHDDRIRGLENEMPDTVKSITINGGTKTYTVDDEGNVNLDVYTTESAEGQATLAEEVGDIRSIVGTKDSPASDTLVNRVGELETLVGGSGEGSVNTRIANAVDSLDVPSTTVTDATGHVSVTLAETDGKINSLAVATEDIASAEALNTLDVYVHNIEGGNIRVKNSTPTNPDTGAPANTVYRVAGTTTYSDYMWNGTTMVKMAEYNVDTLESQFGYYKWETASNTISITTSNQVAGSPIGSYVLTSGGSFKIKMTNKATSACTLNMNGTGVKTLLYNGDPTDSSNTWEENEVISVYYDGTYYQATNAQGGGGKAEKIKYDNSQSGLAADNVQGALDATNQELTELTGKLNGVEFEEKSVTFYSGQKLENNHGSATTDSAAQRTDYINIGKLEEGDVIVWSGTVKYNVLALYNSDYKFVECYTATGSTRTITVSSTVAALNVVYIRITFSASGTPSLTINGKNILENVDYSLALDNTLSQHLPAEGGAVGVRMTNVESAINDITTTSQGVPTLKSGYYINTQGEEVADASWSCTDYIQIPKLNAGDTIYWGGTSANSNGGLVFYDAHKRIIMTYGASKSSRTIDLTSASTVVCEEAKYVRISFSGTPAFTINGNSLFIRYKIATDSTMTLDMPANARGVGNYVRGIVGVSYFRDGYYINLNGNETESSSWCYAMIDLDTPVQEGDVFVWNGITPLSDATMYFYGSDGTPIGGWSATGASRTFTIGDSSPAIGATIIKASFLLLKKDSASVSINGVVQEFSAIKEDKSVVDYNADKQPMVVSLSRTKTGVSTLKKYFCFAQITDTHGENDLVQRAVDFVNSEVFGSSIDCLVHTGDVQKTSFSAGRMAAFHNAMDNSVKPAFTVIGNHDVWNRTSNADLFNRYMKPMVDKGLLVAGTNIDATNYATWYYYDFTEYSIRLIALNDFDPLWDGWSIGNSVMNTTAYSPSQINFLISTLQSVPSGYTVVIVDHFPPNKGTGYSGTTINPDWTMGVSPIGGGHSSIFTDHQSPVIDIISAYKSKTSLVQSYTYSNSSVASHYGSVDVNVDFTSANGILAFMACGHSHNDEVYKFADKNDIIAIDMLGGVNPTIIDSTTKILRTYSGKAHDAINVYCVRTDERKVYVIRIGADFRNDGQAQVMTSFEY